MTAHLGAALNAFVDGELDESRENEVLSHLAWCSTCRSEVEALRGFKAALRQTGPCLPNDLSARLMAVSTFPTASFPGDAAPRAHRRPHLSPRVRRTAVSGAFVVLGIGGAISLAGPPPRQPVAPVDPTNAGFVVDHSTTSYEVPFNTVDVVPASTQRSASPAP
ncbi:MAG: putative transrane anti-sigma factor [Frankiales bacterium]|nr:putative transrane anti-sigma factor [Frankiales bacterium]